MTETAVDAAEFGAHAFLRGLPAGPLAQLALASRAVTVPAGRRIFADGEAARQFWLIRSGRVALDIHRPGRADLIVETLGAGDLLGLSWLAPPFQWHFGAVVVQDTAAFEVSAPAVRQACEANSAFGYRFLLAVTSATCARLQAARVRLLDLYAGAPGDARSQR